ncbi:MAG: class I SAM-dependent methyltransferase, partial [Flavobacteriaceae bacterium]
LNLKILQPEVQQFITDNLKSDITKLILKGSSFDAISVQELANQIVAKQKSAKKLPTWFSTKNIYYPPKLSIEQTSSEITATYKANLISGNSIIDITGGFGVDCFAFSKRFKQVTHCELNDDLSTIVKHNYQQLNINNISTISGNGIDYLKNTSEKFDWIYIDPSRRNDTKGKVFLLEDCLPNVPKDLDFLFTKSDKILIKNSPILDISSTINELNFVKEIHIIAVNNEVKELLFLLEKDYSNSIEIKTINFQKDKQQVFNFQLKTEVFSEYSEPLTFIYEPNTAILKSGGFHQITKQKPVKKLHQHSHLYTSENLIDFPGRRFKIEQILPYDKKELRKIKKANITTRNFPDSVDIIRKKTKIKDGGTTYLFFTTNNKNKLIVIYCSPIILKF